jgi:cyclopropane-fatty-acyl-phospholipid synthase
MMKMKWATSMLIDKMEQGGIPDSAIRFGIRSLLRQRLDSLPLLKLEDSASYLRDFVDSMAGAPVALVPEKANEQHYELPAAFFELVLGKHRKYSSCHWPTGTHTLDAAEAQALRTTCDRADIADGQRILELGCGWGSLSLWMAAQYPASHITAVSNSHSQRASILDRAAQAGLANLNVITCDMNEFSPPQDFDRVVSVEMFEHMRNWRELLQRVADALNPGGKFFMHVFCHRSLPYEFIAEDDSDWMGKYFFAGGMMPSYELPLFFQDRLKLEQRWCWNGRHYEKTSNAWLANMDARKAEIWPILTETYGAELAQIWWMRWRVFFMACAELFGYRGGEEWLVGHYRFARP